MKVARVFVLLVSMWAYAHADTAIAQQAQPTPAAPDEAEHEALRQLRTLYESAIRDNRIEALAPFLHEDFHGVMVTGRPVNGMDDLKRYWTDIHALMGEGGRYTTTLKPERSVIIGDVALARGTSDDVVVTSEAQEFRFTSQWSAVLQKQDGRWKLRQVQGTIDPVDNAFVREFTRRALRLAVPLSAGGGVLLGVALMWIVRWAKQRRGSSPA